MHKTVAITNANNDGTLLWRSLSCSHMYTWEREAKIKMLKKLALLFMKTFRNIISLTIIVVIISCNDQKIKEFPKSSFDSPFPKRNIALTNILGEEVLIKNGNDTLGLKILSTKYSNLITYCNSNDTLFFGKVCRFRGLYYFNEQHNDSTYWIYAVKIADNLIYGLNTSWMQTKQIDREIENGNYKKIVKYITVDKIRLHPNKKELEKLFTSIIDSILPDTILKLAGTTQIYIDTTKTITQIEPDDFEYFSKVYPNPTADFITIELQHNNGIDYQLSDIFGKIILHGKFIDNTNKIDLCKLPKGIYALTLINQTEKQKETIKIIKE